MDKRTHLIERAAARLGSSPTAAIPLLNGSGAPRGFAPDLGAAIAETDTRPSVVGNKALRRVSTHELVAAGLIPQGAENRAAEEFRVVQSKILRNSFAADRVPNGAGHYNLVMMTSALKGEGKSFCAINLAGEVARQGDHRVLLIDTDPKPNGLGKLVGASGAPGLLDLARDRRLDLTDLSIPTETENLEILPFGTGGDGSAELFSSRRLAEAIEVLSRCNPNRLIILDAPPCLASSTPHRLAPLMGQVILVVAAGSTQDNDIDAALEMLEPCPHVSLLLNKVPTWLAHSFGSYAYPATET